MSTYSDSETKKLTSIAQGGVLQFVGLLTSIFLNLILQLIFIRMLDLRHLGIYNIGLSITKLVGLFIIFGFDRTIVHYIGYYVGIGDRDREFNVIKSVFVSVTIIAIVIIPLFLILSAPLADIVYKEPDLVPVFKILLFGVCFESFTRIITSILQGYKSIKPLIISEKIVAPFIRVVGVVFIFYIFGQTSQEASIAYFVASIFGFGISLTYFFQKFSDIRKIIRSTLEIRHLFSFSWPLFGSSVLNMFKNNIEILLLGALSTMDQTGIFSVNLKIALTLTIFTQAISVRFAPYIAELFSQRDFSSLQIQFASVLRWGLLFTLPFGLFIFLDSKELISILKPEFIEGALILSILAISYSIYALDTPGALILTMTEYAHLNFLYLFISTILSTVLNVFLIPVYGGLGAAVSGGVSIIFLFTLRLFQIYKVFSIHPFHVGLVKPLISGTFATLITYLIMNLTSDINNSLIRVLFHFVVFISIYVSILLALKLEKIDFQVWKDIKDGILK